MRATHHASATATVETAEQFTTVPGDDAPMAMGHASDPDRDFDLIQPEQLVPDLDLSLHTTGSWPSSKNVSQ